MHDDRNYMEEAGKYAARKAGKAAGRIGARIVRKIGKKLKPLIEKAVIATGKFILGLIIKTAPIWGPVLLLFLLIWFAYSAIYAIPRQAAEEAMIGLASTKDRIAAFFAFSEDDEFIEENEDLFDRYEEVADTWREVLLEWLKEEKGTSEELIEQAIEQAEVHALPWSILAATDRLTNDPYVRGGKDIEIDPEGTEKDLRPLFDWMDYIEVQERESCNCWTETDEEGNSVEVCEVELEIDEIPRIYLVQADTIEGTFIYHYEEVVEIIERESDKCGTLTTTITKMELVEVEQPKEYYLPYYQYLHSRGIDNDMDIELVLELVPIFDFNYHVHLQTKLNFGNIEYIEGMNGWSWVTLSSRVTSYFGKRWGRDHAGIDIGGLKAGIAGDLIFAMEDGTITTAINNCAQKGKIGDRCGGGYGNYVIVSHGDGLESRYGHLHYVYTKEGEEIKKGDLIGTMGTSGSSTGVHLHFEIRLNGIAHDPMNYFPFLMMVN